MPAIKVDCFYLFRIKMWFFLFGKDNKLRWLVFIRRAALECLFEGNLPYKQTKWLPKMSVRCHNV